MYHGYLPDRSENSGQILPSTMTISQEQKQEILKKRLLQLRDKFAGKLDEKLDEINQSWFTGHKPDLKKTRHFIHKLAGSAGTFGFPEISVKAHAIEQNLDAMDEQSAPATEQQLLEIEHAIKELCQHQTSSGHLAETSYNLPEKTNGRFVYFLSNDAQLSRELSQQLSHYAYSTHLPDPEALLTQQLDNALCLILDLDSLAISFHEKQTQQEYLALAETGLPLIFIASENDWKTRLSIVRSGGSIFFNKPVDYSELSERLDHLSGTRQKRPFRVLVVDDMEELAEHYATILQSAGMVAEAISDPSLLLRKMADFSPDLLLLDLYMPDCSGMEAAQIVRQDTTHLGLPIIFLSTEDSKERQLLSLETGGDDFLTKPVSDELLVKTVQIKAERFFRLNSMMIQDSLTGLLNHSNLKLQLETAVQASTRNNSALSFAMLDIDHFKSVNDTYGHQAGDRVIKSLAHLLSQRLRSSDIIGRYGGEEFAVVLPNTESQQALQVMNNIRELFEDIHHHTDMASFTVTLSAGICTLQVSQTAEHLVQNADAALYQAKQNGRNQVALCNKTHQD